MCENISELGGALNVSCKSDNWTPRGCEFISFALTDLDAAHGERNSGDHHHDDGDDDPGQQEATPILQTKSLSL